MHLNFQTNVYWTILIDFYGLSINIIAYIYSSPSIKKDTFLYSYPALFIFQSIIYIQTQNDRKIQFLNKK